MSTDPDKGAACPIGDKVTGFAEGDRSQSEHTDQKKNNRSVRFPDDNQLVTKYFEPANPWHDVPTTSRAQLAQEYLLACRRHNTAPIDSVLHQIRELPEASIGGGSRAARLSLADCSMEGAAPADALESLLRKVQFRRIDLDHAEIDDEGAEALFDMIEYYESACVISITGPRQFGIRGWQAASRMIKKSAELSEIEVAESALEASHAPVLARALRPHTCRLRALCLQRAQLSGEALMCLVIALKSNASIRELRLPDNSLTPHDAQQLGSLLRFNTNIQLLDLSNNQIQDLGVGHIADALVEQAAQTPPSTATSPISPQLYPLSCADARGLAFLVLWNNQLTRNCAVHLSKALRSSHSLCVLNIGRNALGTDAVRTLQIGAAHSGGALLSLGLQCARLGPEAGAPLADLVRADTKLQRLDLRDNRLGPAGLQALLNAMKENYTLTQIDLDDPAESSTLSANSSEAACLARLTRELRALCRRNEPPASSPERRAHRKLSLTCHTACVLKNSPVSSARRGSRLRSPLPSPAPSPAGSPTPHHHQNVQVNRFSVTRVTPERESSTESCSSPSTPSTPTRPGYPTPSRFKVMQVSEPPSIQIYPAQKRPVSRFSVTRNYDSIYNPSPRGSPSASPTPGASPTPSINSPSPSVSPCPSDTSHSESPKSEKAFYSQKTDKGCTHCPRLESYADSPRTESADSPRTIGSADIPRTEIADSPRNKGSADIPRTESADSPRNKGSADIPRTESADSPRNKGSADIPRTESADSPRNKGSADIPRTESADSPRNKGSADIPRTESADSPRNKGSADIPRTESADSSRTKSADSPRTIGSADSPRTKGSVDSPRNESAASSRTERNNTNSPRTEEILTGSSRIDISRADKLKVSARDRQETSKSIDSASNVEISCVNYELTDVPTPLIYSTSAISSSSIQTGSRDYRYSDAPSITTLSGALFSRNVQMSTTVCPNIKIGAADEVKTPKITVSETVKASSSIPITGSRSEPIFGPALFVEPSVPPTAVPNSRFSISPSPVSYITGVENFYKQEDIKTEAIVVSQTNIRHDSFSTTERSEIIPSNIVIGNRSQETSIKRDPCDIECVSTNMPCNTGVLITDINKEMTENMTADNKLSNKTDIKQKNRFEMVSISEFRVEDAAITLPVKETESSLPIQNMITPIVKHVLTKEQNVPERIQSISIETQKDDVAEITKITVKDIEKADIAEISKVTAKQIENNTVKVLEKPTEDILCKPEEVKFFISDGPISLSYKVDSDSKNSDANDIKIGKTYSDVVKTEPYKDKVEHITYEEKLDDSVVKTETKLVKNSVEISDSDKVDVNVEVTVKTESVSNAAKVHSDKEFVNIDDILIRKDDKAMSKIEAITEDLGNLIQEMKVMSSKSKKKCTVDVGLTTIVPGNNNRDVVLKKNKSESSLDSPDMEVSRLMNKKMVNSPFRDSNSSLEISGSSMESLNAERMFENVQKPIVIQESVESDTELDRRKERLVSASESVDSSEVTPVNSQNFLNTSVSSNESVSPIIFGKNKKIHGSLSSLEVSVSSLDSKQDRIMVTSADSGIEHSLQIPSENKDDASSNEGTLTHNSSLRESVKRTESLQETLTSSPKRTSSVDVPALKNKGLDRMRKISWVAPSPSFHIPRVEPEKVKEEKPSHLEKLLSLFQHPTSLFSRSQNDDERKSASNTPPRKDSSLTSSFWSWGSAIENYKEEKEDSSEATDSTLSERVQVSFVDESFSKKLDSKTPSTDTDNTLSEFQSFSQNVEEKLVTDTTDVVQKCLDLSFKTDNSPSDTQPSASDTIDLKKPNDFNETPAGVTHTDTDEANENKLDEKEIRLEPRPRSFAAVLKASGSENSLEKQASPETGQLVDKLPVKVIRGIKENISPENTLTASMTNTKAIEMTVKHQPTVNALWELPVLEKIEPKVEEVKSDLAPIATIEETCDIVADNFSSETIQLAFIDDVKVDIAVRINDQIVPDDKQDSKVLDTKGLEIVDLGKDALSYLMYESRDFEPDTEQAVATKVEKGSLAQELKDAAIKEMIDLSPELVIDEAIEVFPAKETSPVIPERAKIKANSLEDLSQRQEAEEKCPKAKTIAFKVPETSPRDIPERRSKLRSRSGSSPKSLPESLNKPCPLSKMDSIISKKKKKISSLGKMARDSLLALNMSEEEMAEFRRSYKLTSVESLRSLESVSEDANSQSGTSFDSRCRACLRTSQESLMSLDSITEDCKCDKTDTEKRIV